MSPNSDQEIVAHLRKVLRPTIEWYRFEKDIAPQHLLAGDLQDYLFDVQSEVDLKQVIEALL